MLLISPDAEPDARRRQAIVKVYTLLFKLAKEGAHSVTLPDSLDLQEKRHQ